MDDFGEFYAARKDVVLRAMLAAVSDRADAEDISAEAFARACAHWAKVRHHPNPTAWVLRTGLNLHKSWWRRARREVLGFVPDRAVDQQRTAVPPEMQSAIAALPVRQRQVVGLRVLADLSADETAELLGIAPATVHVHLHRALARLRVDKEVMQ